MCLVARSRDGTNGSRVHLRAVVCYRCALYFPIHIDLSRNCNKLSLVVVHIADLCFRGSEKFVDRLLLFLCSEGFRVPRAFSGSCVGVMAPLGCLRFGFFV